MLYESLCGSCGLYVVIDLWRSLEGNCVYYGFAFIVSLFENINRVFWNVSERIFVFITCLKYNYYEQDSCRSRVQEYLNHIPQNNTNIISLYTRILVHQKKRDSTHSPNTNPREHRYGCDVVFQCDMYHLRCNEG